MSKYYITYMTPTFKEARHLGILAKRLHRKPLPRCVIIGRIPEEDEAIYREPLHGKPRVRVRWTVGTRNPELAADIPAWNRAIDLLETRPYWIAWLQSVWESRFGRKETK